MQSNTNTYGTSETTRNAGFGTQAQGTNANTSVVEERAPGESQSGSGRSHATGKSIVPQKLQEVLPESVERAVPNALHDTSGLPPKH